MVLIYQKEIEDLEDLDDFFFLKINFLNKKVIQN